MAKKLSGVEIVKSVIVQAMSRKNMYDQKDLCRFLRKSESQISRMLNGETQMKLSDLWSLDGILKFTDAEWLALRRR